MSQHLQLTIWLNFLCFSFCKAIFTVVSQILNPKCNKKILALCSCQKTSQRKTTEIPTMHSEFWMKSIHFQSYQIEGKFFFFLDPPTSTCKTNHQNTEWHLILTTVLIKADCILKQTYRELIKKLFFFVLCNFEHGEPTMTNCCRTIQTRSPLKYI
jgi:hypothetical protein